MKGSVIVVSAVLSAHFENYPDMKPQDAVKLIYQNEFGPGHMITDPKKSLVRLEQEMAQLSPAPDQEPLYESIGNGLCRLNLRPCLKKGIPLEDINRLFLQAAQSTKGDMRSFQKKLMCLEQMADRDETPFYAAELDYYLILYKEKGCPAVSHSDAYRAAYAPAYRVVVQKHLKDYMKQLRKKAEE